MDSLPTLSFKSVPTTNGFAVHNRPNSRLLNEKPKSAATYMVLSLKNEYPDRNELINKTLNENNNELEQFDSNLARISRDNVMRYRYADSNNMSSNNLMSSFILPKVYPNGEAVRNMLGKADVETQTDDNLEKIEFEGLSDYQQWTNQDVEPFLKRLRKSLKTERPENIEAFCVAYCYALAEGREPPHTKEQEPEL